MTARGTSGKTKQVRKIKPPSRTAAKPRTLGTQLAEAREQQAATAEILRVISQSPADAQPVFEIIASHALRLCDASFSTCCRFDGELIHLAAFRHLKPEGVAAFHAAYPCQPSRGGITQRAILTGSIVHVADVLEDSEYVYHDAAKAAHYRAVLSVPLLRNGISIGAISVFKDRSKPFPHAQVELLKTFADQAAIAIENVRLFTELEDRNRALAESLEQQTATSEILRVISQSPTDVQPVFDTIVRSVLSLCDAAHSGVYLLDGDNLSLAATAGLTAEARVAFERGYPRKIGRDTVSGQAALECRVMQTDDLLNDPMYRKAPGSWVGARTVLAVPLLRDGKAIGSIGVWRAEVKQFSDSQIALLQTFADQAVIAIENVRLFTELEQRNEALAESLEQQTTTSEILRVISESPTDVQPVLDTIAAAARKLCSATTGSVLTFDGELVYQAALANVSQQGADAIRHAYPRPPSRDTAGTRAVLTRSVVAIPDVLDDADYAITDAALAGGFRGVLAVPLIREDSTIGAIAVGRLEPGSFPDKQIALLKTFADQAVIAIENVRLFKELEARNRDLTEALDQQTATAEILQVMSSSHTDLQPVFDTIVRNAARLCDSMFANVLRFDGELLHFTATSQSRPELLTLIKNRYPMRPDKSQVAGRVIRDRSAVVMEDALADPDYVRPMAIAGGWRRMLGVPMMREGKPIGVIIVGWAEAGPVPKVYQELLKTFADQAVIAIENVRLFTELETRTADLSQSVGELKALGEVGQAVSSTLDLETVLSTIVSRAAQLAGMDGGSIWEYDEAREQFHLHATDRFPDELVDALRAAPIPKGEGALGRLAVTREPVEIRDIVDERSYRSRSRIRETLIRCGYRSVLAVPLLREDHLLGALAVNRSSTGAFAPHVIDLLKTFATQSALAIQNARLFREIEVKSAQLETASRHKSEFLANMSHELRTPLNAIIGFSEVLSEQMFGEVNDKQAEYLKDILESGRHLLSLINDILDLSKIEAGRMELEPSEFDLPATIENSLILVRERANRHGITLAHSVDERLGIIRADERKVKQVLLNLLSNALKFTPEGGRIDVRAKVQNGAAEISVTDTGIGIASEDQAKVFEEFRQVGAASKKVEGTGLGLAISRKFIELHGGTIGVTSEPGVGSTFAFTLPLPGASRHPS